jgi:glycosyltransferase involved in cell wall biosynthesis
MPFRINAICQNLRDNFVAMECWQRPTPKPRQRHCERGAFVGLRRFVVDLNGKNTMAGAAAIARLGSETGQIDQRVKRDAGLKVMAPLLSFVLVNWNYARYVGETIDSIHRQDYENFECVIIDNGSNDDSLSVIERHVGSDPRFRVIKLPENFGQLGAAFIGLRETSGPFVALIDADDVLFPSFASVHVQAHLALPHNVGFTSSNVIEIDGNGACISSGMWCNREGMEDAIGGLKEEACVARLSSVSSKFYNSVLHPKTMSLPSAVQGWKWFPGTSNVLRRSIVDLFVEHESGPHMRASDNYFLPLCHGVAGSALIDFPLSAYRIHGANYYAEREFLNGVRVGSAEFSEKHRNNASENVAVILKLAERNSGLLGKRLWKVIDQATNCGDKPQRFYKKPDAVVLFKKYAKPTMEAVGRQSFIQSIVERFETRAAFAIIRVAHGGRIPVSSILMSVRYLLKSKERDFRHRLRGRGKKRSRSSLRDS